MIILKLNQSIRRLQKSVSCIPKFSFIGDSFCDKLFSQYDDKMTKEKDKQKNIETGDKWRIDASVTLLKLLKANDRVPLLHMIHKNIKDAKTHNMITQFHVGYMSIPYSKQNKTFREQFVFTSIFDTNTLQEMKKT